MNLKAVWIGWLVLCCGLLPAAELQQREWSVAGESRQALVWMPDAVPSNGCPLVFVFHGHGGTMHNAARGFRVHELWPEAAVVYMQGLPTPGKLTDPEGMRNGWNADPGDSGNRDIKFFDAVYASLAGRMDPDRVYSTGHSNGGGFTYCLWAARGRLLAAVAPSASAAGKSLSRLTPKPVLHIAGKADGLVKYDWQERAMQAVRALNGCAEAGLPWPSSGGLPAVIYPSASGTPLVAAAHPGGHRFPPEAPELIVRFFREQRRR